MFTMLCVVAAVAVYALWVEHRRRKAAEAALNKSLERERRQAEAIRKKELNEAFQQGVEVGRETDMLWRRMQKQVAAGQGTIILKGNQYNLRGLEKCGDGHGS